MLTVVGKGHEITLVTEDIEGASRDGSAVDFYVQVGRSRYVGTAITLDGISTVIGRYRETGECGQGRFFWASDLVILEDFRPETFRLAVSELIATGEYRQALSQVDDSEEN